MKPDSKIYRTYVKIPERELVCAEVCTEPVAPVCCAAKARSEPGRLQKTRPYSCRDEETSLWMKKESVRLRSCNAKQKYIAMDCGSHHHPAGRISAYDRLSA